MSKVVLSAVVAHGVLAAALGYISPSYMNLRLSATVLTAALCWEVIRRCRGGPGEMQSVADYMFGLALHANCYLILMRLSPPSSIKNALERLRWGFHTLFSPRMGIRPPRTDPPGITRTQFLVRQTLFAAGICLVWFFIRPMSGLPDDFGYADFQPSKDSVIVNILRGTASSRDIWMLTKVVFLSHAASGLTICAAHCICAVMAVGVLDSPPAEWPPLFGSILEAYSLRRWYSHFWHQAMRKGFTMHAAFLTGKVLRISKNSMLNRILVVLLAFAISGTMHTVTGWSPGTCANFTPLWDYTVTGAVILLEQLVQAAYFHVHRRLGLRWTRAEVMIWRGVGYCWVMLYWMELTTRITYPALRCAYVDRIC